MCGSTLRTSQRQAPLGILLLAVIFVDGLIGSSRVRTAHAQPAVVWMEGESRCTQMVVCKTLRDDALLLYESGAYAAALRGFQSAYGLSEEPFLLVRIGLCLAKQKRFQDALDLYEQYLQAVPAVDPRAKTELDHHIAEAKNLLAKEPKPTLRPEPKVQPKPTLQPEPQQLSIRRMQSQKERGRPVYRAGWFWAVTTVTVAGLALGLGLGLGLPQVPAAHETIVWKR